MGFNSVKTLQEILGGIKNEQLPAFFKNLGKQLNFSLNILRTKIGIVGNRVVGIDDSGRFIYTTSVEPLADGTYGTISVFGKFESAASKIVPAQAIKPKMRIIPHKNDMSI